MNRFFIILVLFCSSLIFGQLDRSKMPEPGPAPEIRLGEYDSFKLDNGLTVFVVENHKIPKIAFSLIINRDPIFEGDKSGYISVTGDLLRTGTKTRTKDQLDKEIDFIGASLSTGSSSVFASAVSRHKEKLMELMSDIILNSEFKQEELDKIILQMNSELAASKEEPNTIANNVRKTLVFGKDHPYGELITEETLKNIKLEDCTEYYEKFFSPSAGYMAVVGDITLEEAEDLVNKYLGNWQNKKIPSFGYKTPVLPKIDKYCLVDRPASVQSVINVCYPVDLISGSPDVIPAYLMNAILGGSFNARLNQDLREDKGYTYGVGSSLSSDKIIGNFNIPMQVRNSVTDSAIIQVLYEMRKMRDSLVTPEELQSMKNYMTGSFARQLEKPETIARFALNTAIYNLPEDYYKNYLKNLQAVTREDIKKMAEKYLHPEKSNILVVGKAADVADGLKKLSISGQIEYFDTYGNKYDPSQKKIPAGMKGSDVIDKYIKSLGGSSKINSIKDMTSVYKASDQGLDLELTIIQKSPDKILQEVNASVFKQTMVFNGKTAKKMTNNMETPVTDNELAILRLNASYQNLLHLDKFGASVKLAGMEQINGKDAYKVEISLPGNVSYTQYFDKESGLLVKQVVPIDTPQGKITSELYFDDYYELSGIKFPKTFKQVVAGSSFTFNLESRDLNTGVQDSVFTVN